MTTVLGELYGQKENPFAEVSENQEEDSFEKVPQVTTQNPVQEICQGTGRQIKSQMPRYLLVVRPMKKSVKIG